MQIGSNAFLKPSIGQQSNSTIMADYIISWKNNAFLGGINLEGIGRKRDRLLLDII